MRTQPCVNDSKMPPSQASLLANKKTQATLPGTVQGASTDPPLVCFSQMHPQPCALRTCLECGHPCCFALDARTNGGVHGCVLASMALLRPRISRHGLPTVRCARNSPFAGGLRPWARSPLPGPPAPPMAIWCLHPPLCRMND